MSDDPKMSIAEAVGLTRQFGRFLKGLARLQEAADILEASESVVGENRRKAESLTVEIAGLQDDQKRALEAVDAAKAAAVVANEQGARIVVEANKQASALVAGAKENLERLNAAAEEARRAADEADRARNTALAEERAVKQRIEEARAAARATFG